MAVVNWIYYCTHIILYRLHAGYFSRILLARAIIIGHSLILFERSKDYKNVLARGPEEHAWCKNLLTTKLQVIIFAKTPVLRRLWQNYWLKKYVLLWTQQLLETKSIKINVFQIQISISLHSTAAWTANDFGHLEFIYRMGLSTYQGCNFIESCFSTGCCCCSRKTRLKIASKSKSIVLLTLEINQPAADCYLICTTKVVRQVFGGTSPTVMHMVVGISESRD